MKSGHGSGSGPQIREHTSGRQGGVRSEHLADEVLAIIMLLAEPSAHPVSARSAHSVEKCDPDTS